MFLFLSISNDGQMRQSPHFSLFVVFSFMEEQGVLRGGNLATGLTTVAIVIVDLVHVAEHEVLLFV